MPDVTISYKIKSLSVNLHIRVCVIHKMTAVGIIVSTVNLITSVVPIVTLRHCLLERQCYLQRNFRKKVDE